MNTTLWSFRTFAALWGVLLAPLAPALAETRDPAELLPADTLAYLGWTQPYQEGDPELQQAERLLPGFTALQSDDAGIRGVDAAIEAALIALRSPGMLALLDLGFADEQPDVQLALIIAAGDKTPQLGEAFTRFVQAIAPKADVTEPSVAGNAMRSIHLPDTPFTVVWGTCQSYFVLTLGAAAAEKMINCLRGGDCPALAATDELKLLRSKVGAAEGQWRLSGYGNVKAIIAKVRALAEHMTGEMPPLVDKAIEALGLNAIQSKYIHISDTERGSVTRIFVHVDGERKGILKLWSQAPLSKEDLQLVPKDAYWAQVWNLDLANLWSDVRETIEEIEPNMVPMVEGSAAMVGGLLGFSITDQLLPAFGDTWALFDAREHGGILLTGTVLVAEVRDAQAVHGALARTVELLKPVLEQEDVHLALHESTCQDRTIHHVLIGGVPCPVAPAWTFVGDRMVFGLFPQTVAVAAQQVDPSTRRGSILDEPAVRDALQNVFPQEIQSFGYNDAQYFARLFYPLGLLYATAGISMLSRPGVELDPAIYPVLASALEDVRTSVGMGTADKDGIHYAQVGSANAPVSMVAVAVAALLVSILLPSLSRARELAKRAVSASNLRGIGIALAIYAHDHGQRFPESTEVLVEAGLITRDMLNSPRDKEGNLSYVYITGVSPDFPDGVKPQETVVVYERIIGEEGTNVLFLDGHVEWMKLGQFKRALLETYQRLGREDEMPADLRP